MRPAQRAARLVVAGSSTGGTQAIETVLSALPADGPPIAIVQHMPAQFTTLFAQRLHQHCAMEVREARDGDRLERGLALVAPGGRQLELRRRGDQLVAAVLDGPPVNRHRPSVDVLFRSAAACAVPSTLAIILTGMGGDGARGMRLLHDQGARTIAQAEAGCVVYGMPKEAVRLGGVDRELPLEHIAAQVVAFDAS